MLVYRLRIFILMIPRTGMLYYCFLMTPSASQKRKNRTRQTIVIDDIDWVYLEDGKHIHSARLLAHGCGQYFEVYEYSEWLGGSHVTLNAPLGSEMRPRTRSSDKQFITFSLPRKTFGWRASKQFKAFQGYATTTTCYY